MRLKTAALFLAGLFLVPLAFNLFAQETSFPRKMPAETYEEPSNPSYEEMARVFADPFGHVRTGVYWYWLSGNFSTEGVVKDLQAMKSVGIDRAYIGDIGVDGMARGAGRTFSPQWWDAIGAALKTASELDIEMGIFNSPGWSQSGGPWVTPERAMRYLASSSVTVSGPAKFSEKLPVPGTGKAAEEFRDVKVVAYPEPPEGDHQTLDFGEEGKDLPKDSPVSFSFKFDQPATLRSLVIETTPSPVVAEGTVWAGGGADPAREVAHFKVNRFNPDINVGFIPYAPTVVSLPEIKTQELSVVLKSNRKGAGVRRITVSQRPQIDSFYEKTLAKLHQTPHPMWTEYQWPSEPPVSDPSFLVDPSSVVDLSDKMAADGTLTWDVPEGNWVILRTGMTPTGQKNAPAVPEATGYETDKMSREHIQYHFDSMLGEILKRFPEEDTKSLKYAVLDSYEVGGQNFTDAFFEKFEKEFGYDPTPYLPAFFGTVVGDPEKSDRFLWDLRRFVADEIAYSYVGGLRDASNEHGLKTWLECYGHWGFCGEFLQYGGQSNEVAGEYWSEGTLGDIENRIASSCGHIYGKRQIWAESNTAAGEPFGRSPVNMKVRTDRFFSEGINSTLLHLYVQQPDERVPGMNAWFGNEFNRHNTWFTMMDLFTGYLKRSNYLLQQGVPVSDVLYFIGEDAPKMMGVTDPEIPAGFQYDFINAEVIESALTVKNGKLVLPNGAEYRVLILPQLETMRPELLRRIMKLVEEGAIVMGPKPKRSPSLQNYPEADREVQEMADRLWGKTDGVQWKSRRFGEGLIVCGKKSVRDLLGKAGEMHPDCEWPDGTNLVYCHRRLENADVYFVANQSQEPIDNIPVTFRAVAGKLPECWDPVSGTRRDLSRWLTVESGKRVTVPLSFAPQQSYFIVFAKDTEKKSSNGENFPAGETVAELTGPWTVTFKTDEIRRGPREPVVFETLSDWARSENPEVRDFSGDAVYKIAAYLPQTAPEKRIVLQLGKVCEMARVRVNGVPVGGVWTFPYELDITSAAKPGQNEIEVEVVNCWQSRLSADGRLPAEERKTWLSEASIFEKTPGPKQSGLLGPVVIKSM